MSVHVVSAHEWPHAGIELYFRGGSVEDPPGLEGLHWITAEMLLRGTLRRGRAEQMEAIEALGASVEVSVGRDHLLLEADVLSAHLEELMALLGEALSEPVFDEEELEKLRRHALADHRERRDSDEELCRDLFHQVVLAPDPAGRAVRGTEASLEAIRIEDVRRCHAETIARSRLVVGACGDVTEDRLRGLLEKWLPLPDGTPSPGRAIRAEPPGGIRVVLIDKPERIQTQLMFGHPSVAAGHPDFLALSLANTAFGGTFTARLSREIREKRGWSYGAYSYLLGRRTDGTFVVRYHPSSTDLPAALEVGLQMQRDLCTDGLSDDEVAFARQHLEQTWPFRHETPRKRVGELLRIALLELPQDTNRTWLDRVRRLTVADVNRATREHLRHDDLTVVIVCTADRVREAVEAIPAVDDVVVHPWDRDWRAAALPA